MNGLEKNESQSNPTFNKILKCSNLNDEVQNLIDEAILGIETSIGSLTDSQEHLLSQIKNDESIKGSYITQCMKGLNNRRLRKPFFSSDIGLCPVTSETQKKRDENCSYDYYEVKHELVKACTQLDKEIIQERVGAYVYDQTIKRIYSKKNGSTANEIKKLNDTKLSDLSKQCTDDMINKIKWEDIAYKYLNGRLSPETCRKLWKHVFNPTNDSYNNWTNEQCQLLLKLVKEHGSKGSWCIISSKMPCKRAPFMYYRKWIQLTCKMESDDLWSTEEDILLKEIMDEHKTVSNRRYINWNSIASKIPNRSAKDCSRRWGILYGLMLSRSFTSEDDMELLLLIKRLGTENWHEITRNTVKIRTPEQCSQRYCELVDELQPWSYLEDRKIWTYLRSFYEKHWQDGEQVDNVGRHLDIYRKLVPLIPGRDAIVIRHRFHKLIKWFKMWNGFVLHICRKEGMEYAEEMNLLLTGSFAKDPKMNCVLKKLKSIIINTSFFETLINVLRKNNYENPDVEAEKLIRNFNKNKATLAKLCKTNNDDSLTEFFVFLEDLQRGFFIPKKFVELHQKNVIYKEEFMGEDLRLLRMNVLRMDSTETVKLSLKKEISRLVKSNKVDEVDNKALNVLSTVNGIFDAAFIFASKIMENIYSVSINCRVDSFDIVLKRLLRLMVQFVHEREQKQMHKNHEVVKNSKLKEKRKQIADLLILRDHISKIYKTYAFSFNKQQLFTKYLPNGIYRPLFSQESITESTQRVEQHFNRSFQHPQLDIDCNKTAPDDFNSSLSQIELLPLNRSNFSLLRYFVLQTSILKTHGEQEFLRMNKIKYDHPFENVKRSSQRFVNTSNLKINRSASPLFDDRYLLLRARILSIFAFPTVATDLSISACEETANQLYNTQNNQEFSDYISSTLSQFEPVNTDKLKKIIRRKRTVLEILDTYELDELNLCSKKLRESDSSNKVIISDDDDDKEDLVPKRMTRRHSEEWFEIPLESDPSQSVMIHKQLFELCSKDDSKFRLVQMIDESDEKEG